MKCCILMASPRPKGNTAALLVPFTEELSVLGVRYDQFNLYTSDIHACIACRKCQDVLDGYGCVFNDDMNAIVDSILDADCLILATPIYSWYCTAPLKAALDRLVYLMNKYYGEKRGGALWKGKHVAVFSTCGYSIPTLPGSLKKASSVTANIRSSCMTGCSRRATSGIQRNS